MENEEPPKKRKKSEKKKKSKSTKVSPENSPQHSALITHHAHPDGAADVLCHPSADINPLLPPIVNDSGDSELELSTLMAESADGSVEECVLPTVPSLADMLSQSDICSSIASAGSSLEDGDTNSQDHLSSCSDQPSSTQITVKAEPCDTIFDLLSKPNPCETSVGEASSCTNSSLPVTELNNRAGELGSDEAVKAESINQSYSSEQAELDAHAHELLDSMSATSITASTNSDECYTSKDNQEKDATVNSEGYITMHRYVVKDVVPKGQLEALPEGWKELAHETGMSIYIHLKTRVVTWSRPYYLDNRYAKTHPVPVGAIPCMVYRRCKDLMEGKPVDENTEPKIQATAEVTSSGMDSSNKRELEEGTLEAPCVKVDNKSGPEANKLPTNQNGDEKKEDNKITDVSLRDVPAAEKFPDLDKEAMMDYCKSIFTFEKKEFKKFENWKVRKDYEKNSKFQKKLADTKDASLTPVVISASELPEPYQRDDKGKLKRDFYSLPGANSVMDIYMSYATWLLRKCPIVEHSPTTSGFECKLKSRDTNIIHGIGSGHTKKSAKENAAINALESLVPKYAKKLIQNTVSQNMENINKQMATTALSEYYQLFDAMSITDQRVVETAKSTNQIYPLPILKACIARNFAMDESCIKAETTMNRKGRILSHVCDMNVGQFSAKGVPGKNSRLAIQYAAQEILQQLHSHLKSWGSILRLYGTFAEGSAAAIKQDSKTQSEITQIGSSEKGNKSTESGICGVELKEDVCTSVLLKLKEQMKKVYKERQKHLQSGKKRKYEMSCTSEMHLPLHTVNMKPEESEDAVRTKSNQTVS